MIALETDGRRFPVATGETTIGSGTGVGIPLEGTGVAPRHAVVRAWPDGTVSVAGVAGSVVRVNGIAVSAEPMPLLHGDRIEIGERQLLAVDQAAVGGTQLMSAITTAPGAEPSVPPAGPAYEADGRLLCLTDGREYRLGGAPVVFGREAGAGIVVSDSDVSRRHAEIRFEEGRYLLSDSSSNGTFVNGDRVRSARPLERGDVIRVGRDEFRFSATPRAPDAATAPSGPAPLPVEEPEPAAPVPAPAAPEPAEVPSVAAPTGAAHRLHDTYFGAPVAAEPAAPASELASLLVRNGPDKGRRHAVRVPVVNLGRGEYNDIVLADSSVSTMHAKLQRRDGIWILSDLGSTNGTFADGERVVDEVALGPGATIRLGEVTLLFEPRDEAVPRPEATRVFRGIEVEPPAVAAAPESGWRPSVEATAEAARIAPPKRPPLRTVPPPRRSRAPYVVLIGLVLVGLALAFVLLRR